MTILAIYMTSRKVLPKLARNLKQRRANRKKSLSGVQAKPTTNK